MAMLGNGEHYALEVAGDSMVEAGILDGDTVIIRKGETAENGQIVVALVDETEVTLKRLRRRATRSRWSPPISGTRRGYFRPTRCGCRGGWWRCCGGIERASVGGCRQFGAGRYMRAVRVTGCRRSSAVEQLIRNQ